MVNFVYAFPEVGIEALLVVAHGAGAACQSIGTAVNLCDLKVGAMHSAFQPRWQAIERFRPDLAFSTSVDANIVAAAVTAASRHSPPLLLRENNSHHARGELGAIRRRVAGWAYRRVHAVVAASRGVRRMLIEGYRLVWVRIVILLNPIEVAVIAREATAAPARPSPLLVASGCPTRQKGHDILIDSFATLRSEGVRLAIPGDGPDRAALQYRACRLGIADRVLLPGFIERPIEWLVDADLFVLSSRWSGFGHVIFEAMAAGVPVVATDCPHGPADIVDHDKNGILIRFGGGLGDQFDGLLASPWRCRLLRDMATFSARGFESRTVAGRYADLFRRVIAKRKEADVIDGRAR